MTGWETFTGRRVQAAFASPTITVMKSGQIYLNAPAAQLLGDATRVELLWDAGRRRIGVRPASETTPHSYALTAYRKGWSRQASAGAFLTHYGLLDLLGQTFPAHLEGDVLVVPLAPATDGETEARS